MNVPTATYPYPDGFDPETNDWLPGFEKQREEWERQYTEAQTQWESHKKQIEDSATAEADAAGRARRRSRAWSDCRSRGCRRSSVA